MLSYYACGPWRRPATRKLPLYPRCGAPSPILQARSFRAHWCRFAVRAANSARPPEKTAVTRFPHCAPGKYNVRVIAKGFTVSGRQDVEINGPVVLDAQLIIQADTQVLNVDDEANSVVADPTSNGSALVLREKELSALSDDPDELQQQLQAMAGPGAGPNGGQIYIDGFTGGNLPNKSSIREVRINSNPFRRNTSGPDSDASRS